MPHVAGSAFGLALNTTVCPISDPTGVPIDTAAWGIELELVGDVHRVKLPGTWVSSLSPWTLSFTQASTVAWPEGKYIARLTYISPEATPRRFTQPLGLVIEVAR
jgi:hypothetical protein